MKKRWIPAIVAMGCLSCQRKVEAPVEKSRLPAAGTRAAGDRENLAKDPAAQKPTKAAERPAEEAKRIPLAEPVADQPGIVKSPFSGKHIDVTGISPGTLVADPTYPAGESKHFRVPEALDSELPRESPPATYDSSADP